MTDLIDRADSGEIPRFDETLADDPTRNLRAERDAILGSQHYLRSADPTAEIPVIDVDDTVTYLLVPNGVRDSLADCYVTVDGELDGPQKPPPSLPKPKLRRSVPVAAMVDRESPGTWGRMRHRGKRRRSRQVSPWLMLAAVVAFGVAVYAGAYVAGQIVLAVVR